jgi:hypothetical protein
MSTGHALPLADDSAAVAAVERSASWSDVESVPIAVQFPVARVRRSIDPICAGVS